MNPAWEQVWPILYGQLLVRRSKVVTFCEIGSQSIDTAIFATRNDTSAIISSYFAYTNEEPSRATQAWTDPISQSHHLKPLNSREEIFNFAEERKSMLVIMYWNSADYSKDLARWKKQSAGPSFIVFISRTAVITRDDSYDYRALKFSNEWMHITWPNFRIFNDEIDREWLKKVSTTLGNIVSKMNFEPHHAGLRDALLDFAPNWRIWMDAFTTEIFDPNNNYETIETIGDKALKPAYALYSVNRFYGIDQNSITALDNKYMTKDYQPHFSKALGLTNHVRTVGGTSDMVKTKVAEDIFESVAGAFFQICENKFVGYGLYVAYQYLVATARFLAEHPMTIERVTSKALRGKPAMAGKKIELVEWSSASLNMKTWFDQLVKANWITRTEERMTASGTLVVTFTLSARDLADSDKFDTRPVRKEEAYGSDLEGTRKHLDKLARVEMSEVLEQDGITPDKYGAKLAKTYLVQEVGITLVNAAYTKADDNNVTIDFRETKPGGKKTSLTSTQVIITLIETQHGVKKIIKTLSCPNDKDSKKVCKTDLLNFYLGQRAR